MIREPDYVISWEVSEICPFPRLLLLLCTPSFSSIPPICPCPRLRMLRAQRPHMEAHSGQVSAYKEMCPILTGV